MYCDPRVTLHFAGRGYACYNADPTEVSHLKHSIIQQTAFRTEHETNLAPSEPTNTPQQPSAPTI